MTKDEQRTELLVSNIGFPFSAVFSAGNVCPSGSRPWPLLSSSKCYRLEDEDLEDSKDCFMHLKEGRIACMAEDELVELRVAKGRSSRSLCFV